MSDAALAYRIARLYQVDEDGTAHFNRDGQIGCIHGKPGFCWRCEELRIMVDVGRAMLANGGCGCKTAKTDVATVGADPTSPPVKRGPGRPRKNADA